MLFNPGHVHSHLRETIDLIVARKQEIICARRREEMSDCYLQECSILGVAGDAWHTLEADETSNFLQLCSNLEKLWWSLLTLCHSSVHCFLLFSILISILWCWEGPGYEGCVTLSGSRLVGSLAPFLQRPPVLPVEVGTFPGLRLEHSPAENTPSELAAGGSSGSGTPAWGGSGVRAMCFIYFLLICWFIHKYNPHLFIWMINNTWYLTEKLETATNQLWKTQQQIWAASEREMSMLQASCTLVWARLI